jgi:hypothetical protein
LADNAPLNDLKKNTFLVVTARNTSFEMGKYYQERSPFL